MCLDAYVAPVPQQLPQKLRRPAYRFVLRAQDKPKRTAPAAVIRYPRYPRPGETNHPITHK